MMKQRSLLLAFPFLIMILMAFQMNHVAKMKTVVIDAGHGGDDTGVIYDSIQEKDIIMNITNYMKEYGKGKVNLVFLRNSDEYLPLSARIEKIKAINPDLVISLHLAIDHNVDKHGAEAFVYSDSLEVNEKASKIYGNQLLESLKNTPLRGKETAVNADFYLIKNLEKTPSVILELGYISNQQDRDFITVDENQKAIAKALISSF